MMLTNWRRCSGQEELPGVRAPRALLALSLMVVFVLGDVRHGIAQEPVFWGRLQPGPYAVGFRSSWRLDHGRTYAATFDDGSVYGTDKAARPILVNIWYPALRTEAGRTMRHRDYLEIGSEDPAIGEFAGALARYNLSVITEEITGESPDDLDRATTKRLEALLATPTAAARGAAPVNGRFPIVIYHSGHGSSYEDNAVLCEYLASHGYVVLGSAFQAGDGEGLGTDTRDGSTADLDELIRFARTLPNADWRRIGLVGHSGGAQHALLYAARPGSAVDAFVLLDTTQDYYSLDVPFWPYTKHVLANREYVVAPLLFVANPHAFFQVADSLSGAERFYLTLRGLSHNEFISQGLLASAFAGATPSESVKASFESRSGVMPGYEALATDVRRFLDGYLKGDSVSLAALRYRSEGQIGGQIRHVEYVARGVASPPEYVADGSRPPTPRQFRYVLKELGANSTVALLRQWAATGVVSPVLETPTFAVALLYELVENEREQEAATFYEFFQRIHPSLIMEFLRWYDVFEQIGDGTGRHWLGIAEVLDPSNPEVVRRSAPQDP